MGKIILVAVFLFLSLDPTLVGVSAAREIGNSRHTTHESFSPSVNVPSTTMEMEEEEARHNDPAAGTAPSREPYEQPPSRPVLDPFDTSPNPYGGGEQHIAHPPLSAQSRAHRDRRPASPREQIHAMSLATPEDHDPTAVPSSHASRGRRGGAGSSHQRRTRIIGVSESDPTVIVARDSRASRAGRANHTPMPVPMPAQQEDFIQAPDGSRVRVGYGVDDNRSGNLHPMVAVTQSGRVLAEALNPSDYTAQQRAAFPRVEPDGMVTGSVIDSEMVARFKKVHKASERRETATLWKNRLSTTAFGSFLGFVAAVLAGLISCAVVFGEADSARKQNRNRQKIDNNVARHMRNVVNHMDCTAMKDCCESLNKFCDDIDSGPSFTLIPIPSCFEKDYIRVDVLFAEEAFSSYKNQFNASVSLVACFGLAGLLLFVIIVSGIVHWVLSKTSPVVYPRDILPSQEQGLYRKWVANGAVELTR